MKQKRALIPLAIASALLLSGCSGSDITQDAAGIDCAPDGSVSNDVEVEGDFGSEVTLTSETPATVDSLERTVITTGDSGAPEAGATLSAAVTYINGATGDVVQFSPGIMVANDEAAVPPWVYEATRCASPGERTALVVPATEVLGDEVEAAGIEGLTNDDSLVIVMDFSEAQTEETAPVECNIGRFDLETLPTMAEGKAVTAAGSFPEVETAENGEPTITIPEGEAPPETLEIATLIEGDGAEVQPGDCVAVNYRGVIWDTGEEFDSSWSRGEPTAFPTDGVIPGFKDALEGQKIGSQVISVVPAEDGGYGAASLEQMGQEPDAVMVFVLDILGVAEDPAE